MVLYTQLASVQQTPSHLPAVDKAVWQITTSVQRSWNKTCVSLLLTTVSLKFENRNQLTIIVLALRFYHMTRASGWSPEICPACQMVVRSQEQALVDFDRLFAPGAAFPDSLSNRIHHVFGLFHVNSTNVWHPQFSIRLKFIRVV